MDELPVALLTARARASEAAPEPFDLEAAEGLRRVLGDLFLETRPLLLRLPARGSIEPSLKTVLEEALGRVARSYEALCAHREESPSLLPVLQALKRSLELEARALEAGLAGDRSAALEHEAGARELLERARSGSEAEAGEPARSVVFDRVTGRSRYDASEEPDLTYPLRCPQESCGEPGRYPLAASVSTHRLTCRACELPMTAYVGVVESAKAERSTQSTAHEVRTSDFDGTGRTLRFEEASGPAPLELGEKDLVVVLYDDDDRLCIVKNMTRGGEVWVAPRSRCFVVAAATSPDAPEVRTLRAFREARLRPHPAGRALIALYERLAPPAALWIRRGPRRRALARHLVRAAAHLARRRCDSPARPRREGSVPRPGSSPSARGGREGSARVFGRSPKRCPKAKGSR
ncbi:MAG: hypothetical protein P1V51_12370 [Deltaproteobacteria bacterium]|nr:hypothetical protein [Deltaproteobacteria bacterium]